MKRKTIELIESIQTNLTEALEDNFYTAFEMHGFRRKINKDTTIEELINELYNFITFEKISKDDTRKAIEDIVYHINSQLNANLDASRIYLWYINGNYGGAYEKVRKNKITENYQRREDLVNKDDRELHDRLKTYRDRMTKKNESVKINETTGRELDKLSKGLRDRKRQALIDNGDNNPDDLTNLANRLPKEQFEEFEKEGRKIRAIRMIHSILTYTSKDRWTEDFVMNNKYMQDYIKELGDDVTRELINREIADYKEKATINHDVYTDGEDVSYNSVTWSDDEDTNRTNESCEKGGKLNEATPLLENDTYNKILSFIDNIIYSEDDDTRRRICNQLKKDLDVFGK